MNGIDYFQKAQIADELININYLNSAYGLVSELRQESSDNHASKYLYTRLLEAEGRKTEAKEYYPKEVSKTKKSPAILRHMSDFKFRADDDWAVNWGSAEFPGGIGIQDGADHEAVREPDAAASPPSPQAPRRARCEFS